LENPIATKLLENTFVEGDTIMIDLVDLKLTFNKKRPAASAQPAIVPQVLTADS
jgi:ATP-dependent Clp protease ATP-binding subunit ClpB